MPISRTIQPSLKSILFVITRGDLIGGAQIHVRDLCRALQEQGVKVTVACGSDGILKEELAKTSVRYYHIPWLVRSINPLADFKAVWHLKKLIHHFRPDLISTHTAKAGMVGRLAAFWTKTPALFTAHGWQFAEGIGIAQKIIVLIVEWFLARYSKKIITVSDYDRNLALKYQLGSPDKIELVHNGMPWRERSPKKENLIPRIITVARFQPQKDYKTLVESLNIIKNLSWTATLVGDGPNQMYWKQEIQKHSWADRVVFYGQILHVPELMEECDIFVLSSLWEGFPRSILEAMRASLPVVCSNVGGVGDSVLEGRTGFIVPVRQPQILAEKLALLIQNPKLRLLLGKEGRLRYEREFTFQAMFEKTQKIWQQLLL